MGRSKGKTATPVDEEDGEPRHPRLLSSDDEEANEDLSLGIVEKARQREEKRKMTEDALLLGPASASATVVDGLVSDRASAFSAVVLTSAPEGERKKKQRKPKKKKQQQDEEVQQKEALQVGVIVVEEKPPIKAESEKPLVEAESVITEVNEASENLVFRKLLRGPRYFDPGKNNWETCFNCGEEGHIAANCMVEKRQKPCYFCGLFGHNSKQCLQGQDCFVCKRRGHLAKDCPDKNKKIAQESGFCLRCGETGHVMLSCRNDYSPNDLEEMQCYVCKKYGHLCCVNFMDAGPREVFCYNCAQPGHTGLGCAKPYGDRTADASSAVCYICHEEGHFARGCTKKTKFVRKTGESSTFRALDKNRRSWGPNSVPRDFGKEQKKNIFEYDERRNMSTYKSKMKSRWIVEDPGDLPRKKFRANNYSSPVTPVKMNQRSYSSDFSGNSSSSHTRKKWKPYIGTPGSHATTRSYY